MGHSPGKILRYSKNKISLEVGLAWWSGKNG